MSDDFIRGLRNDLETAMERYERRSPPRRAAAALQPRRLRPATLASVAAAAAIVVAVLVVVRAIAPDTPPARPHVVAVVSIGGTPTDAHAAGGELWAGDINGSLVRVDPRDRRVVARIAVPGAPAPIAGDAGSVWVQTARLHCEGSLLRIDARSGRIVLRARRDYPSEQPGSLAPNGDVVWVERGCRRTEGVDRVDAHGRITAHIGVASTLDGLAPSPRSVWLLGHDGTVVQIDAKDARVRHRWPRLAPLSDPNTNATKALAADAAGAWVLSTGRAAILRIENGRVARRIAVPASTRPLLARGRDGMWITTGNQLGGQNRLVRIDPGSGTQTGAVELGNRHPVALVPVGDQLCVVTSEGKVLFVRP